MPTVALQAVGTSWQCEQYIHKGEQLSTPDLWLLHMWRPKQPPLHMQGESWRYYASPFTQNGMDARRRVKVGFPKQVAYLEYKALCLAHAAIPRTLDNIRRWLAQIETKHKRAHTPRLPLKWRTDVASAEATRRSYSTRLSRSRVNRETKNADYEARLRLAALVASVIGVTAADKIRKVMQLEPKSAARTRMQELLDPTGPPSKRQRRTRRRTYIKGVGLTTAGKGPPSFKSSRHCKSVSTQLRARRDATQATERTFSGIGGDIRALTYDPQQGTLHLHSA